MAEDHLVQEISNVTDLFCGHWHSLSPLGKVVGQCDTVVVASATDRQFDQINSHLVPGVRDKDGMQGWCWFVKLSLGPLANFTVFHQSNVRFKAVEIHRHTYQHAHYCMTFHQTTMHCKHVRLPILLCLCRCSSSSNGL